MLGKKERERENEFWTAKSQPQALKDGPILSEF